MKCIVLILALLSVVTISTQQGCPDPVTQANFDVSKYTGMWYEVGRTPTPFENGLTCITTEYALLPNGSLTIHNAGLRTNGSVYEVYGIANIPNASDPANFYVTFASPIVAPYWVLETDYDSYALVFTCANRGPAGVTQSAFILSRDPDLSTDLITDLYTHVKDEVSGFDNVTLITGQQKGCKYDTGSGTGIASSLGVITTAFVFLLISM